MVDTKRINLLTSVDAPTAGDRLVLDGLTTRSIEHQKLGAYLENVPWASFVTIAGETAVTLDATHRRAFISVDTFNGGSSVAATEITFESAEDAGVTFVTIKKQKDSDNHGGMVKVGPSGDDEVEGIFPGEDWVRFEYPGEEWTWVSDGVSKWHLVASLWLKRGAPIKGTHTGSSADVGGYSTASPYAIELDTGNGQKFQIACNAATAKSVAIDLPLASGRADGYSQTAFWVQRMDGETAHSAYIRANTSTYDGRETGYSHPLRNYLDAAFIHLDGEQYRTLGEFHAHQSEICSLKLSTSASSVINGVVSAATTIYFTPRNGMRVAVPTDQAAGGHYQRWIVDSTPGTPISKAIGSAGTYGVAAGNSVIHDIFCFLPSGFSQPVIFLGPSYAATRGTGAGTSELVRVGGVNVNAVSISGSTTVPAQAARYVGRIITNGAGAAIVVLDEFDEAPGNQIIVPQGSGSTFGLVFAGDYDTGLDWTSADTFQIITGGGARATWNASGLTMENSAAINGAAINDTSMRVTRAVGSGTSGSTNDSASGSGAYITHTGITVTVPASGITIGRMLRTIAMFRFTTGAVPTAFSYALMLGGTTVAEITASTPAINLAAKTFAVTFITAGLAVPGAAANTESAITAAGNAFANQVVFNNIGQPVALATNGTLAVQIKSQWASAGTGPNTATLIGLSSEFVN